MSGTPYKAQSLRVFTPKEFVRVEAPGLTMLVGRLIDEKSVVRVLGDRSRKLATFANILQVSVSSAAPGIRISRRSFSLQMPAGEHIPPLLPHQVLAAVSLPTAYWVQADHPPLADNPAPSGRPAEPTGFTGPVAALLALSATGVDLAVKNAGAKHYREAARHDVVRKTTLDCALAADQTVDLLLVFAPPDGKISPTTPLEVAVELEVGGVLWATTLEVPSR
jgi:hypothetical protein